VSGQQGEVGEESSTSSLELRTSDADRRRVVDDLQRDYADGRLTTEELRERIGLAMAARTYSDLEELQRDLPKVVSAPPTPTVARASTPPTRSQWGQGFRVHAICYLMVVTGLVIIWLLTTPGGYFWPVWPAFGWSMGLAAHAIACKTRSPELTEMSAP
jgi:hypothetical protein